MVFVYILIGAAAGVLGGMGMGGGTALIPMLTLLTGMEQKLAQGINLISFIPLAAVSLIIHFKNKLVEVKKSWLVIIPAALASAVFSFLCARLESKVLKICFGIFLAGLGVFLLITEIIKALKEKEQNENSGADAN